MVHPGLYSSRSRPRVSDTPAANSKLAAILAAKKLQEQFDDEDLPITIISLHPGAVWTGTPLATPASPFDNTDRYGSQRDLLTFRTSTGLLLAQFSPPSQNG